MPVAIMRSEFGTERFKRTDNSSTELAVDGSGTAKVFEVKAAAGEDWYVDKVHLALTSAGNGWKHDSFVDIAGGLTGGLLLRVRDLSEPTDLWTMTLKDNVDLHGELYPFDTVDFSDNKRLGVFVLRPTPGSILVSGDKVIQIVVQDDLSGLSTGHGFVHFGKKV